MANYVQDYLYAELPRELIEKHVKWIVVPKIESVTPATENDLVTIAIVPNRDTKTYDMYITREVDGALTWYKLFQHPIPALPGKTSANAGEYVLHIGAKEEEENAWVRVEMPKDGVGVKKVHINSEGDPDGALYGHMIVTYTDGKREDAGYAIGPTVASAYVCSEGSEGDSEGYKGQLVIILSNGKEIRAEGSTLGPQGEQGIQGEQGPEGVSVERVHINSEDTSEGVEGDLIVYLTDGTHLNAGMAYDPRERAERIAADSEERAARIAGDDNLQAQLDGLSDLLGIESHAREDADDALDDKIKDEAAIRLTQDAILDAKIVTEKQGREAADTALRALIDSEARIRAAEDTGIRAALKAGLDSEAAIRAAEDLRLLALIDSERRRAMGSEARLDAIKQDNLIASEGIVLNGAVISAKLDNDTLKFNSEGEILVDLLATLPDGAGKNGKALTIDSEGNLSWGEAGKIDSIEVSDGTTTKVIPLANRQVTIRTDKGIGIATDGKIIHTNEIVAATIPATSIFIPKGVDAQGHITDGATGASNALREVKFLGKDSTTNAWVELESATISGQEVTKAVLKVAGYNPALVDKYRDATLKIDSNGLTVNLSGAEQKILATDTSEQFIIVNGNKLSLSPELLRRLELVDFKKNVIDSEGLNDPRFYPTIQLLNDQLGLKQDELTADYPIVITSEDRIQLLYDTDTLALKPATSKLYVKDVNMAVWGKLTKLLTAQTSEGNKLVDMDYLNSAISGNLGTFRGNFDSVSQLPTKAQVPSLAKNDYAFVTTEVVTSEGVQYFYNRYKFADTPAPGHWEFEYRVSGSTFTVNQLKAINSNWTNQLTDIAIDHFNDTVIHVTSEDKVRWDGKQDTLTASKGIVIVSKDIQHTNTITAQTTKEAYKVTLDAQGHVNGIPEVYHPDWEVEDQTKSDFIKHRPAIKRGTGSSSLDPDRNTGVILNDVTNNVASGNYSVAEGQGTIARGITSHAEGYQTITSEGASYSHAEGEQTTAIGLGAHAEGKYAIAQGDYSHAEGTGDDPVDYPVIAIGLASHAEGYASRAEGESSHAEGSNTQATAYSAHAEGRRTTASGEISHAEGFQTIASGLDSHAEGGSTGAIGDYSHAEGNITGALGESAHAEGRQTTASGSNSHAEGYKTIASGYGSHAEGAGAEGEPGEPDLSTIASGRGAHAEGYNTIASGNNSHAEGWSTRAIGHWSHAEGNSTKARGLGSHTEGFETITSEGAEHAHAEGYMTKALAQRSHVEGRETTASGNNSHAEGYATIAAGNNSHAEGEETIARSKNSHTEGEKNEINIGTTSSQSTDGSHAEGGWNVIEPGEYDSLYAHIEGSYNRITCGRAAHAEGEYTFAGGTAAHVEGSGSQATGSVSHAEGSNTTASGESSHTEGGQTVASGEYAHAEGFNSRATGIRSHTEGDQTTASGERSHAEGYSAIASGRVSHAEGYKGTASGFAAHVEGGFTDGTDEFINVASGPASHAEGEGTTARGEASHAEGYYTLTSEGARYAHAEGQGTKSSSRATHAEGVNTVASGDFSHAEGGESEALNSGAHAEGWRSTASGIAGHAEGNITTASGDSGAHAEGSNTVASGAAAHAEGLGTTASGAYSHAEGGDTVAQGDYSHAEGGGTTASGDFSHAEGYDTTAANSTAHAEGSSTRASGSASHAEGQQTIAASDYQHVQGLGNIEDSEGRYADIVGWGTVTARKNISSLTTDGDLHLAGKVYMKSNDDGTGGIPVLPDVPTANGTYVLKAVVSGGVVTLKWE